MEQNTVGHIDLHGRSIHDHRSMLQINMEESHRITFMIQRHQKLIIREELRILRILTADRQQEILLKQSRLLIHIKYSDRIISCNGAEQIIIIQGKTECAGTVRIASGQFDQFYRLNLLESGIIIMIRILIDINVTLQFMQDINISAIL